MSKNKFEVDLSMPITHRDKTPFIMQRVNGGSGPVNFGQLAIIILDAPRKDASDLRQMFNLGNKIEEFMNNVGDNDTWTISLTREEADLLCKLADEFVIQFGSFIWAQFRSQVE